MADNATDKAWAVPPAAPIQEIDLRAATILWGRLAGAPAGSGGLSIRLPAPSTMPENHPKSLRFAAMRINAGLSCGRDTFAMTASHAAGYRRSGAGRFAVDRPARAQSMGYDGGRQCAFLESLRYLLHMAPGKAPPIPLDEALRPTWLFGQTVPGGCDRGGYYEQAEFAEAYGSGARQPGSLLSSKAVMTCGRATHALRRFTQASLSKGPNWRREG